MRSLPQAPARRRKPGSGPASRAGSTSASRSRWVRSRRSTSIVLSIGAAFSRRGPARCDIDRIAKRVDHMAWPADQNQAAARTAAVTIKKATRNRHSAPAGLCARDRADGHDVVVVVTVVVMVPKGHRVFPVEMDSWRGGSSSSSSE